MVACGFAGLAIACALVRVFSASGPAEKCTSGCSPDRGTCDGGVCRCKPGWQGAACERCVPFPGCLHGTCEKAWQCVCQRGWVGSQCDRDARLCSSRPCPGNSTCVETGEGGFLCICPPGYTGKSCQLRDGPCLTNGSPCENGGTCVDRDDSGARPSCRCPPRFTGALCESAAGACEPNPCLNGGTCTHHGRTYACACLPAFSGPVCVPDAVGRKAKAGSRPSPGHRHHAPPGHAVDEPPRSPRLLKVTVKETVHTSDPLITGSQMVCFAVLGLLTCLVVLGTTGIIFFNRCESWLANAKYSQLVRQQKELVGTGGGERPVHFILPEKIKLNKFGRRYTSI